MKVDYRSDVAKFYDHSPNVPKDVPFYINRIPAPSASVLELGCGTGRVTIPLAQHSAYVGGLDRSQSMIAICQRKLEAANVEPTRAMVQVGDITQFALDRQFDLIVAPFRVLQNQETDREVDGLLSCIRQHLAPNGSCILNAFHPNRDPEGLGLPAIAAETNGVRED